MSLYRKYKPADVDRLAAEIVRHLQSLARGRHIERLDVQSHRDANFDFLDRIGQRLGVAPKEPTWRVDVRFDPRAVAMALMEKYNFKMPPEPDADLWSEEDDEPVTVKSVISLPPEREE